jgi:hypothetical protein
VLPTVGYISYGDENHEKVIEMVREKLRAYHGAKGSSRTDVRVEDALRLANIGAKGEPGIRDAEISTVCPTCKTVQWLSVADIRVGSDEITY